MTGITSAKVSRGMTGAPYVRLYASDGAELQIRAGVFGSKSKQVVAAVEAITTASAD